MSNKKTTVEIKIGEATLSLTGHYTPRVPGAYYDGKGDPGDPPVPAEFEIEKYELSGISVSDTPYKGAVSISSPTDVGELISGLNDASVMGKSKAYRMGYRDALEKHNITDPDPINALRRIAGIPGLLEDLEGRGIDALRGEDYPEPDPEYDYLTDGD